MARFGRSPRPRISAALEIAPPTLMIALGHPWLGAATLAGVLASATLQAWILVRSDQEQHRATLSYAQHTASMGGDPATVIAAMQGRVNGPEEDGEPSGEDGGRRDKPPWS